WYAGNQQQPDLQTSLIKIISKLADDLRTERLVFFGGSGGGFAAMFFSYHFPGSLALVFNPQTKIANYSKIATRAYAQKAFGVPKDISHPLTKIPTNIVKDLCA